QHCRDRDHRGLVHGILLLGAHDTPKRPVERNQLAVGRRETRNSVTAMTAKQARPSSWYPPVPSARTSPCSIERCSTPAAQLVFAPMIATATPATAPPATRPVANRLPGPSSSVPEAASPAGRRRSATARTRPPTKMGSVVDSGRYAPTAKDSDLTPH